ncbi:hypothetical protein GCM10010343_14540 [Streptomyces avidinii]|nr:hypothetical protein GCM10010343_14540 [Streptomyces avidinii]
MGSAATRTPPAARSPAARPVREESPHDCGRLLPVSVPRGVGHLPGCWRRAGLRKSSRKCARKAGSWRKCELRASADSSAAEEAEAVDKILALTAQVERKAHRYLVFNGD